MSRQRYCRNSPSPRRGAFVNTVFIVLAGASSSLGQSPLYVHTQPANAIRATSAQLNGMVVPGSNPATVWFEWGTSTNYGYLVGRTNLPSGGKVIPIRQPLDGLSPDYAYHCRLVASNLAGIVYGADLQFTLGATVLVWGNPSFGTTTIPDDLTNAVAIGGGGYHCAALRNDGTIVAWGGNAYGQADVPLDLTHADALSVGQLHNLALLPDGTVLAWGAGTSLVPDWPEGGQSMVPAGLANVVQIAAGTTHSLALKADGTVVAWGSARLFSNAWTPLDQSVVPVGLSNVVAISGGDFHNLALKADGTVVVWGYSDYGQADIPPGLTNVVAIAAGWYHNFARRSDGSLVAWGMGEVDSGFPNFGQAIVPSGLSKVMSMAGGGFYSLICPGDGTTVAWGQDDSGQVSGGNGLINVVALACGYDFGLAMQSRAPMQVALTLQPLGNQLQLTWLGGVLQSASEVDGAYADMTGATSPLVLTPSEARQFYRVRVQP